ncbi:hypothetical protein [Streptomyces sp. CBMA123]|uniref:hypothetical protein n=1 Tax=Streptomyces sp. CBMA123 TaxID=1896313 RepID=UPI0016620DAD|nr:hypothetical protein [Streptomyces sp. CBMA123]MBD0695048.1 hypothetical protein [Streptomyces sp. CBMA123]
MTAWLRGAVLAAGLALTGFGLYGLLNDVHITDPWDVLAWVVGGLVVHDGLWLPLLCLFGSSLARGPVLRGWLIVAASATAIALPAVLRAGADDANPTVLPLPYQRNWLLVLAASAVLALLVALVRRWRHRPGSGSGRAPREDPS